MGKYVEHHKFEINFSLENTYTVFSTVSLLPRSVYHRIYSTERIISHTDQISFSELCPKFIMNLFRIKQSNENLGC